MGIGQGTYAYAYDENKNNSKGCKICGKRWSAIKGYNEERAENGKKTIQNALIGLVIVILSFVIVTVVVNALLPQGRGV